MEQNLNKDTVKQEEVKKEVTVTKKATNTDDTKLVVTFSKPVQFEGKTYEEVDLTEIENINGAQIANFEATTQQRGIVVPELSSAYAFLAASAVSGLPIEFFEQLKVKEAVKIKRAVSAFLND